MSDKISTEAENPALRKAVVTGSLPFVMFPDDNKIRFWQDFSGWEGIPSDRRFYPKEEVNGSIVFIADRYGILKNNKWNLSGASWFRGFFLLFFFPVLFCLISAL